MSENKELVDSLAKELEKVRVVGTIYVNSSYGGAAMVFVDTEFANKKDAQFFIESQTIIGSSFSNTLIITEVLPK